ncbi:MAG: PorV/PorQ family protein [Fidelibacterota bacterium]
MKTAKRLIAIILAITAVTAQDVNIPDQVTKVASAAENWLKLETSARAIGMGGAQVAAATGVQAITYNPASLSFIDRNDSYYSKVNYIAGTSHSVLAYGIPLNSTDFMSFHLFTFDSGPIGVTTDLFPTGTGEDYHVRDLAFRVTYAKILTDRLNIGLTLKYIREDIYTAYAQTFAIDIGSIFDTGIYGTVLGMSVSNFGPEIQYHGEGLETQVPTDVDPRENLSQVTDFFQLPMIFRLGIKNDLMGTSGTVWKSEIHRLTFALDGMNPIDYVVSGKTGIEYAWQELAFIRLGYRFDHDTAMRGRSGGGKTYSLAGLSAGAGVSFTTGGVKIGIDYAFVNYGILDNTHQYGLRIQF